MMDLLAPANFSPDRAYRISLSRRISMLGDFTVVSCGFNPSTAAETLNDPTIGCEIALCRRIGAEVLVKVNILTACATEPDDLAAMVDPVGPEADAAIRAAIELCRTRGGIMLATWGAPKGRAATRRLAERRMREVAAMADWHVLRLTASGHPAHPLYLPGNLVPTPWAGYPAGVAP